MMKPLIAKPLNSTQRGFNELCEKGGGKGGGPLRGKVQELLSESGKALNNFAYKEVEEHISEFSTYSPWHVCFVIGIAWGHLADLNKEFVGAAVRLLDHWNASDLAEARKHHYERGPEPI